MNPQNKLFSAIRRAGEKLLAPKDIQNAVYSPNPAWYGDNSRIPIQSSRQANALAPTLLNQAKDCADLLNNTVTPTVFFERYDFLLSRLDLLTKCGRWVHFSGTSPNVAANELRSLEKRTAAVDDFLERYKIHVREKVSTLKTIRGKKNNLEKARNELLEFADYISPQQLQDVENFFSALSEEINSNEISKELSIQSPQPESSQSLSNLQTSSSWEVSLSFGVSRSPAFQQALYLWEHAPRHVYLEEPTPVYQCFFSADPDEFLAYLQLYDIIKGWKTTSILVNGQFVDKKIMSHINYCYGDKCRYRKEGFCFGASDYSENPFGCHRLQIESYRNPWYSYGHKNGKNFFIDKCQLRKVIEENSVVYRLCPAFDLDEILHRLDDLPSHLSLKEIKEMNPYYYYSTFGD